MHKLSWTVLRWPATSVKLSNKLRLKLVAKGALKGSRGRLGGVLEGSWRQGGSSWNQFGPRWAKLRPSWASWGQVEARLDSSWGELGPSWSHVGASWGKLGPSWGKLEPNCSMLVPSWAKIDQHRAKLGQVGRFGGPRRLTRPRRILRKTAAQWAV